MIGAEGREEKEHSGHNQRFFSAESGGQQSGECASENASEQGAGGCDAVDDVGIYEVGSSEEKGLQTFLST